MARTSRVSSRFNLLNLFRPRRNQFYGRIRNGLPPRLRRSAALERQSQALHTRLSTRKVQSVFAPPNQIDRVDGASDAHHMVNIIKRGKPDAILQAAFQTSNNPMLDSGEPDAYTGYFFSGFYGELENMSNRDIAKLHRQLNSNKMRQLRGGLVLGGNQGFQQPLGEEEVGIRGELKNTRRHLEAMNSMLVAEMDKRGMKLKDSDFGKAPALQSWRGAQKTQKQLLRFSGHIDSQITSAQGHATNKAMREIRDNFTKLSAESEGVKVAHQEGGVGHLVLNDESSKELNVSDIYITDFGRGDRKFVSADGAQKTNVQLGFDSRDRAQISNHLTEFCEPTGAEQAKNTPAANADLSANQARRLQAVLTQQTVAPIYTMQARGKFGRPPTFNRNRQDAKDMMSGSSDYSFTITRKASGNVEVHLMQRLRPLAFHYHKGSAREPNQINIDNKKSYIRSDLSIIVPRQKSAAPIIRQFTYNTHIVEKD